MEIELHSDEADLLEKVELDHRKLENGDPFIRNMELVAELFEKLRVRKAIPEWRMRVFTDERYATGRHPSPLKQFQQTGNSPAEMIRHPDFPKWLSYFLSGPDLPAALQQDFQALLDDIIHVSSSDHKIIYAKVRELVRRYKIPKSKVDEFFKLALEHDLELSLAHELRRQALTAADW